MSTLDNFSTCYCMVISILLHDHLLLISWVCHFKSLSNLIFFANAIQSLARMNKKDSWLFWWSVYLTVSKVASVTSVD